jgi:isopentenyl diphosphate isomerase/L-lactate dehydrogenase-like FMN-dependent dehydrogenase
VEAFAAWQIRPRVLVDVGSVSTTTTLLGAEVSMPVLVAPVAFQRLAHADGEAGMARAAAAAGTVMCVSTIATAGPSEVADGAPEGRRWFQLYLFKDRAVSQALVDEAVDSGYEAIVLTVDGPYAGPRERDLRTGFQVPPDVRVPSLDAAVGAGKSLSVREVFSLVDPTLTWADLERLASGCSLPVLVKGVLTKEDAQLAIEHGAAGVVVSNHGGRQLDRVPAALEALPEVVEAVSGRAPVLMDGGIRRGSDVLVAMALGADAVLVGRPALWGLAVAGEAGALRVLEILRTEFELALALSGIPALAGIGRECVQRKGRPPGG